MLKRINFQILIPAIALVTIGLATLYSIDTSFFRQQFIFFFIAIVSYIIFSNANYYAIRLISKPMYIVMIILLSLLFVVGIEAKGAVRWIDIFGIRIQFSEIMKPFFIFAFADYLTRDDSHSFKKFVFSLLLFAPIFILILKQPDLGNALIYLFVVICMLLSFAFPFRYFLFLAASAATISPLAFNFLHDYQKNRILTFFNITNDPLGTSYNAIQSQIAIGSGGFFGKGFGQATQSTLRFLPERHTDFIFATIAESLGFVGAAIVTGVIFFFLYKLYKESLLIADSFSRLVMVGFYFLFFWHTFFNIGMNAGLLPIVGITLPFISYGGSSLVTSFMTIGLASSIASAQGKKASYEIK